MTKISSLTSPSDFKNVFRSGSTSSSKYVVVRYVDRHDRKNTRMAFIAGKRFGKAVERNRAKRILRESCRRNRDKIAPGYDIVVIARPSLKSKSYWEAEKGLLKALAFGGLIKRES